MNDDPPVDILHLAANIILCIAAVGFWVGMVYLAWWIKSLTS